MKFYPFQYYFMLSIILFFSILYNNCTKYKKISINTEWPKPSKTKQKSNNVAIAQSKNMNNLNTKKTDDTDYSFSNIDGKTGINSNTGDFGISYCYNVIKSNTEDFTESSNNENLFDINDVIVQAKLDQNDDLNLASIYKLKNFFSVPEKTKTVYFYKKVSRKRTFSYDTSPDKLLTPSAYKLFQNTITKKDQIFLNNCGDSVVDKVEEGGIIIIQVIINIIDKTKSGLFKKIFGKEFVKFEDIGSKSFGMSPYLGNVLNISIKAKQIGGNLEKFITLFPQTKNQCVGPAFDSQIKQEGDYVTCGGYFSFINNYFNLDFKSILTNNSVYSTILELNKKLLKELKIPEIEKNLLQIKSMKKNITNFINQNDYYLKKIKEFNEGYPFFDSLHYQFDDDSDKFVTKLKENEFLLKENVDGVFRFNDCFSNLRSCTKENFDKSYAKLFKDFAEIDELYFQMKELYQYDLKLQDCAMNMVGGLIADISVRIYPLGNYKYGILYVSSDFKGNINPDAKKWTWRDGKVNSYNKFEFIMKDKISAEIKPVSLFFPSKPIWKLPYDQKSPLLTVTCKCSTQTTINTGYVVDNPRYFTPYISEK